MGSFLAILLLIICITHLFAINSEVTPRETLQIIIGGGDDTPPSPPPESEYCPPPPPPPEAPTDGFESPLLAQAYKVIQAFKKKITIDPTGITKTWIGKDICRKYKGFICDKVPDLQMKAVAGVNFNNRRLYGPNLTFGELLLGLKHIAFFHANSNNFTGTIPAGISKLEYLYELDLSNNKFAINFPTEVLGAKKLVFLDLRFNFFRGFVPPQVFLLDYDLLFINNNNLAQQTLPGNLGLTPAIFLTFANNKFVGGIPPSIGKASNTLQEVLFLNNKLSGCMPYEIGFLKKATVFDVGTNELTGPIPHSFQCLEKMELLNLAHNKFYNEIPEAVCSLPGLSNFTSSYNYFTQVGPKCRNLIKRGVLDVKMNCILDLPNQRSLADCAQFFLHLPTCPNEKTLTYVPCSKGYSSNQLEASDVQLGSSSPALAPAQSPRRSYGALSPN